MENSTNHHPQSQRLHEYNTTPVVLHSRAVSGFPSRGSRLSPSLQLVIPLGISEVFCNRDSSSRFSSSKASYFQQFQARPRHIVKVSNTHSGFSKISYVNRTLVLSFISGWFWSPKSWFQDIGGFSQMGKLQIFYLSSELLASVELL